MTKNKINLGIIFILQILIYGVGIIAWRGHVSFWFTLPISFSFVIMSVVVVNMLHRPFTLVIAMIFCFLGDIFMSGIVNVPSKLLFGMGAFGVGHIFFIITFVLMDKNVLSKTLVKAMGVYYSIIIAGWFIMIYPNITDSVMLYGALGYALLLATTASFAISYSKIISSYFVAIGGLSFLVSDIIIGIGAFGEIKIPYSAEIIWFTYIIGLAGLIYQKLSPEKQTEGQLSPGELVTD